MASPAALHGRSCSDSQLVFGSVHTVIDSRYSVFDFELDGTAVVVAGLVVRVTRYSGRSSVGVVVAGEVAFVEVLVWESAAEE